MRINPWVAVILICVGVVATVVFSLLRIPEAGIPAAVVSVGIAILTGGQHAETSKELVTLRKSLRAPPPETPEDAGKPTVFPSEPPTGF